MALSLEIQLSRGDGWHCRWRSSYQEERVGIVVGDPVIKRRGLALSLEIQLSRGEGGYPINPATSVCLFKPGPGYPTSYAVVFFFLCVCVFSE